MGNYIKVAVTHSIVTLYKQGWSQRRIARELGIRRETVSRYIRLSGAPTPKPAIPTAGNSGPEGPKPAIPTAGNSGREGPKPAISTAGKTGRRSRCEPFREQIEEKLGIGLSAQRIYQDLVYESGFTGSYESVKRFVRTIRKAHPRRIYRIECRPGEEAQVDFGSGAPILQANDRRKKSHVLRITLSFSRRSYSESIYHQTSESFIRCLENAFRYFGGVPQTVCLDNLKAAVTKADWFDPDINPKIEAFARHYGTVFMPTRPYTPEHKGKIESGVKYVKNNALKGRVFRSLGEQNAFLGWWERHVADLRIHGTTRKQVRQQFEEHEKVALQPLPPMLFPCFEEGQRTVHQDSYVEVARSYYEVPEEYIGRQVWVRWDARVVRVYNQRFEQIGLFARLPRGKFSSCLGVRGTRGEIQRNVSYWLSQASLIGSEAGRWADEVIGTRGPLGIRVVHGLLALVRKNSAEVVEHACGLANSHGAYRLRDLRRLIRVPRRQDTFEFLESHPLIRNMADYGAVIEELTTGKEVCAL